MVIGLLNPHSPFNDLVAPPDVGNVGLESSGSHLKVALFEQRLDSVSCEPRLGGFFTIPDRRLQRRAVLEI
jgi:hypothetical protein